MTTASHAAAGAIVGSFVGVPALAFAAGIASHALLDVVPHYDLHDWRIDVALTVGVSVALIWLSGGEAATTWGLIGGALPDLENLFYKLGVLPGSKRVFPTHDGFLPHGRALGLPHAAWQLAIGACAFWRVLT